jgi:hypothetical protein
MEYVSKIHKGILKTLFRFVRSKNFYVLIKVRQNFFDQEEIIKLGLERITLAGAIYADTFI